MNPWGLTPRQCEVMASLTQHGCNKQVARGLGVEERTVAQHVSQACKRVGVRNRVQLALEWDRWARGQQGSQA